MLTGHLSLNHTCHIFRETWHQPLEVVLNGSASNACMNFFGVPVHNNVSAHLTAISITLRTYCSKT